MPADKAKSRSRSKSKEKSKDKSKGDKSKRSSSKTKSSSKDEAAPAAPTPASGNPHDASIDFEAGRFFERADTRGTLDQAEFQRLWRAARSGEPMEPPTKPPAPSSSVPPPPSSASMPHHQSQHKTHYNSSPYNSSSPNHDQNQRWQPSSGPSLGLATAAEPPPPSALPLPADFDAGSRFERFDSNHDGYLTKSEFVALVNEWGRSSFLGPELFEKHDHNRDGLLSRGDFLSLVRQESSAGASAQQQHASTSFQFQPPPAMQQRPPSPLRDPQYTAATTTAMSAPAAAAPNSYLSTHHSPSTYPPSYPTAAYAPLPPHSAPSSSSSASRYTWFNETMGIPLTSEGAQAARSSHLGNTGRRQNSSGHGGGYGHGGDDDNGNDDVIIVPLKEAHANRVAKLQEQLAVTLLPKRARLKALSSELRRRLDEVSAARVAVERETVADCDAILARLRSNESVKVATLAQNANEVDAELDAIDRLTQQLDQQQPHEANNFTTSSSSDEMLSLIQSYPDLVRSVERLASRSMPQIDDSLYSSSSSSSDPSPSSSSASNEATSALLAFPRETKQRLEAMAKISKYEEVLAVKDRMIWELTQGRKQVEEKLAEEKALCEEYSDEMTSWLALTDRLSKEVNHLRGVSATAKSLEEDLEGLLSQRREDRQEIEKLRAQADETTEILEENVALRQHLATMQRDMRTLLAATSGDREEEGGGGEGGVKEGFSSSSPDKHGRLDVERR